MDDARTAAAAGHAAWSESFNEMFMQVARCSRTDGSKGPRLYDWALIGTAEGPGRHLLVRRSLQPGEKGTLELAFCRCWSPRPVTLPELTAVAGARWGIEDCFAEAKGEAGLDHYQVRRYRAWYRHATLAALACAFLAVTARAARPEAAAARGKAQARPLKRGPDTCGQRFTPPRAYAPPAFVKDENGRDLIPLTAAEARRLFNLRTRVTRARPTSTSTGQAGDDYARQPPADPTTPEDSEIASCCCSNRSFQYFRSLTGPRLHGSISPVHRVLRRRRSLLAGSFSTGG